MKRVLFLAIAVMASVAAYSGNVNGSWTEDEALLMQGGPAVMRVLKVTEKADEAFLRRLSSDIPKELVGTDGWRRLAGSLLATVQDEANPGVGIAGPQVGISRRVVAVQRFDKEGAPFEIYPNIRITAARGERKPGPEGCLSVPDRRGDVLRWQDIDIAYTSVKTLADTTETVKGYTAVIFQHECDHLDGLLFTDRLKAQEDPGRIADDVRICLNHENGLYAIGDTVTVTAGMLGVYDRGLEMTILTFERRGETRTLGRIGIRDTVLTWPAREPVAVILEFRAEGQTPAQIPEDVNTGEDSFRIGFVVAPESYKAGNPVPRDVKKFWKKQVAQMRKTPIEAKVREVPLTGADSSALECFDVELNAPDGIPVKGYYCRPRNAAPKSLPIVIRFHSAGVTGDWAHAKPSIAAKFARKGAICFNFNALGMENDREKAYYDSLAAGPLHNYSSRPLVDRETYYFKNMILRAVRGLDYAALDPAWNGKTVVVYGESQGGFQSAMLAGIDSRVTDVIVNVPAGVGTAGSLEGRSDSWPDVLDNSGRSKYALDNAPYFDGAVLLKGCKADCLVEIGLIDTTCPPAEVFSGFNSVKGKVRYITCPYRPHHLAKVPSQYRSWWDENVGDVRNATIDAVINGRD